MILPHHSVNAVLCPPPVELVLGFGQFLVIFFLRLLVVGPQVSAVLFGKRIVLLHEFGTSLCRFLPFLGCCHIGKQFGFSFTPAVICSRFLSGPLPLRLHRSAYRFFCCRISLRFCFVCFGHKVLLVPKHFRQLVGNAIGELLAVHHISKPNWLGTHRIICRFNSIRECFPLGRCVPEDARELALQFGISNIKCHSFTRFSVLSRLNANDVPVLLAEV